MNDKEFETLTLKATLCPQREEWPNEHLHWQLLCNCVDEARERVAKAWSAMKEIDADRDLSAVGRERKKKKVAAEALSAFDQSKSLVSAKNAVERQVAKWAEKTGLAVKQPTNIAEAVVQSEIRAHLSAMKGAKLGFVEQHLADPRVASAVLGAPAFLSGLTDAEVAVVQKRIEQHVAPEVAEARDATLKALQQAEQGWQRALDKIAERANLAKNADATWHDRPMSDAA